MDMTVQHMRLLREVASQGTIAAAAASLGYTPSAVSQQLTGLEKTTGVAILERVGRNVRLTDAGRVLVDHANDLLAGFEAAKVAVEQVNNEVVGELSLAVYESVASTLLVPLLAKLAVRHPGLALRTEQVEPDVAIDAVAAGGMDLAFAIDYAHAPAAPRKGIERTTILEDRFFVVVAEDDSLTGPIALTDLADRPFVASPTNLSCGRCVMMACHNAGFQPNVVHQLDDYPTTLRLVAAGLGVALVPVLGLVHVPDGIRAVPLAEPLSRQIQLAHRTASSGRPVIQAVYEGLFDVVAELETPAGLYEAISG